MNRVKSVLDNFQSLPDNDKKDILLYRDTRLDNNKNKYILEATLNYIKNSERFSGSLFKQGFFLFAFFYIEYFHPKLNHHISLIFHAYNVLLPFFNVIYRFTYQYLNFPPTAQNKKNAKEMCVGSVNSFDARSRHFRDFLHLYKC